MEKVQSTKKLEDNKKDIQENQSQQEGNIEVYGGKKTPLGQEYFAVKEELLNAQKSLVAYEITKNTLEQENTCLIANNEELSSQITLLKKEYISSQEDLNLLREQERSLSARIKKIWRRPATLVARYLRRVKDIRLLMANELFDEEYYLQECVGNKGMKLDLADHFYSHGWKDLKNPSENFSVESYLTLNPHVADFGINPLVHYLRWGKNEGLRYESVTEYSVSKKRIIPASLSVQLLQEKWSSIYNILKEVNLFDDEYYLKTNPDIAGSIVDPLMHFIKAGALEGRNPCADFDVTYYFLKHSFLLKTQENPLVHYLKNKARQGLPVSAPPLEEVVGCARTVVGSQGLLVSVIMATWNRKDVISRAIDSVLSQAYPHFELLIVDDGSEDETIEFLSDRYGKEIDDGTLRCIQQDHLGVCSARNKGLSESKGDIITYLDSDNEWVQEYLLMVVSTYIDNPSICTAYSYIQVNDNIKGNCFVSSRRFDYNKLVSQNYIDLNVFSHRSWLIDKFGGFNVNMTRLVDYDLVLRFTKYYPPKVIPYVLCYYYLDESLNNITSTEEEADNLKYIVNGYRINWDDIDCKVNKYRCDTVSIIIPVYNNYEMTKSCVESIYKNTREVCFRIIIVDNASNDETSAWLKEFSREKDNFFYIWNYVNLGFSVGCNLGITKVEGEFVLFLNNDTVVLENWLAPLLNSLNDDPFCGMVGPKLLFEDDTLQCGGMVFNNHSKIPYHIYQGEGRESDWINKKRYFQSITGACMLMRTSDFVKLRGFDITYKNGCEDLDLCFRLRKELGKSILYNPESEIYHYEGKTEGRGANILYNRQLFVDRWAHEVVADDGIYFNDDGFRVTKYEKKGTEPDGEIAAYYPQVEIAQKKSHLSYENVVFCSIWHKRGISYHALQLANALDGAEFRTHIFARWESDRFDNSGSIFHPRVTYGGDDPSADNLIGWLKKHQITTYIQMEVHPNDFKRLHAVKDAGIHLMIYENLDIMYKNQLEEYEIADSFLCNTKFVYDFLQQNFPNKPIVFVPWGVEQPKPLTEPQAGKPIKFLHIGGWGGINNRKNTDLLIRAFVEAKGEAELHLYSQVGLEKYGADIAKLTEKDARIIVHEGTVNDIRSAYQDKDVLLWPSKREGLGLPIVEALASGLAVLISDGYMMKEWIIPGEHGLVCPATPLSGDRILPEVQVDLKELTRMIESLIADPSKVAKMKQNVHRDRAIWIWDWQKDFMRKKLAQLLATGKITLDTSEFSPPLQRFYEQIEDQK